MNPLEDLKKRLNKHTKIRDVAEWDLYDLAVAAIRLAEIYRDIAAGDRAENYVWTDSKASRLFKGEDGEK